MDVKVRCFWFRVAISVAIVTSCCAQTTVTTTSETTAGPESTIGTMDTLDTTNMTNVTTVANTTGNTTSMNFTTTIMTTDFDYSDLDWTSGVSTTVTDEYGRLSTEDIYSGNGSNRIPTGDGSSSALGSSNIMAAAITAGIIVVVFAFCYVGTMMNLCICRSVMYECPSGRYREAPKEVT